MFSFQIWNKVLHKNNNLTKTSFRYILNNNFRCIQNNKKCLYTRIHKFWNCFFFFFEDSFQMINFLLNFVFINDLTVKGQLWVTDEEVVSLIRCSSLRFVSVKLFFSFKTCFWLFQSGSFLKNLHCLCYFLFLAYFLLLCFSYIE